VRKQFNISFTAIEVKEMRAMVNETFEEMELDPDIMERYTPKQLAALKSAMAKLCACGS